MVCGLEKENTNTVPFAGQLSMDNWPLQQLLVTLKLAKHLRKERDQTNNGGD